MRFALRHHQGKGRHLHEALIAAGHVETRWHQVNDVVLIDYDLPYSAYSSWVLTARNHDAALVAYPHGFSATWAWDLVETPVDLAATLVPGPGQKALLELYGYPHPVHVIGWPESQPTEHLYGTLFAPHHPLGSGFMQPDSMEENAKAFRRLIHETHDKLTVRLIGSLEQNGLWDEPGVHYIQGAMDGTFQTADTVVARGTYAANCLQAGATVVTYDQDGDWRLEAEDRALARYPEGWREHRDFTRYPYDLDAGIDGQSDAPEVMTWKERFMPPFDPEAFTSLIERIAEEKHAAAV